MGGGFLVSPATLKYLSTKTTNLDAVQVQTRMSRLNYVIHNE